MHNTYFINIYKIQHSKTNQICGVLNEMCDLNFNEQLGSE